MTKNAGAIDYVAISKAVAELVEAENEQAQTRRVAAEAETAAQLARTRVETARAQVVPLVPLENPVGLNSMAVEAAAVSYARGLAAAFEQGRNEMKAELHNG